MNKVYIFQIVISFHSISSSTAHPIDLTQAECVVAAAVFVVVVVESSWDRQIYLCCVHTVLCTHRVDTGDLYRGHASCSSLSVLSNCTPALLEGEGGRGDASQALRLRVAQCQVWSVFVFVCVYVCVCVRLSRTTPPGGGDWTPRWTDLVSEHTGDGRAPTSENTQTSRFSRLEFSLCDADCFTPNTHHFIPDLSWNISTPVEKICPTSSC